MGNSPSRSELHGEHMSNIANTSGQETFQSHTYPATKFSANPLPGIHGEVTSTTKRPNSANTTDLNGSGSGRQTGGPNTPDPMYSMDSLNVVGTSITSSELPPSSISPDAQCRNMSRLHKNYHNSDDEGLSSSTFESDSLNPDATLSGMLSPRKVYINNEKREQTPKPEVAEEAKEEASLRPAIIDHSTITINGRKVSTCEETPLPLIVGSQKEPKIGITSAEVSIVHPIHQTTINGNSTIRRGRLPPPPPPPARSNGTMKNKKDFGEKPNNICTSSSSVPTDKKDIQNSLNSLLHHNVFSSNRRSNIEISDSKTVCGGEVNVIQTPLLNNEFSVSPDLCKDECEGKNETEPNACMNEIITTSAALSSSPLSVLGSDSNSKIRKTTCANNDVGKDTDTLIRTPQSQPTKVLPPITDESVVIRPCELQQAQNCTAVGSATQSIIKTENEIEEKGPHVSPFSIDSLLAADTQVALMNCSINKDSLSTNLLFDDHSTTAILPHECEETPIIAANPTNYNKTELDCEDVKKDVDEDSQATTTAPEIKPVSCSTNGEKISEKIEYEESNRTDDNVTMIDGSESPQIINTNGGVDGFNDVIETENKNNGKSTEQNEDETETKRICPDGKIAVSEEEGLVNSNLAITTTSSLITVENAKPTSQIKAEAEDAERDIVKEGDEKSKVIAVQKLDATMISPVPEIVQGDKSSGSSKSSSRRSSASSSIDLNAPLPSSTTGLLNCNRLSLCRLPDNNELEFETFETSDQIMEDIAIQDQPMSNNSNNELMGVCLTENANVENDEKQGATEAQYQSNHNEEEEKKREPTDIVNDITKEVKVDDKKILRDGLVNALRNSLEGLIPMVEPMGRNIPNKVNGYGHQRRLSMSRVDFEGIKPKGDFLPSSVPTGSCTLDKFSTTTRKGSFPELFINTESASLTPIKVATGKDRNSTNQETGSSSTERNLSSHFCPDSLIGPSLENPNPMSVPFVFNNKYSNENEFVGNTTSQNKGKPFANEFLQTLGEIYASKSKLLTCKTTGKSPPRSNAESLPPSPKEKDPPSMVLVSNKMKTGDVSLDTVIDALECQDRSISEYNISPRSARELISESLFNSLTSLSQKSIGTIHEEVDEKLVAFSAGVETKDVLPVVRNEELNCSKAASNENIVGSHIQPKSLMNSGTFKKKPTFSRENGFNVNSMPCVDPFDEPQLPSSAVQSKIANDMAIPIPHEPNAKEEEEAEEKLPYPPPPPMPPLHYCQTDSSASASSSIGDASEICEKNRTPFNTRIRKQSIEFRHYNDKSWSKSNGNGNMSSECSLVELTTSSPKSTSDAIIVELKKAQAKKLKAIEQKRTDPQTQIQCSAFPEDVKQIICVENGNSSNRLDKASPALDFCKAPVSLTSSEASSCTVPATIVKQPDDSQVKTIVNGKHTNSIAVNSSTVPSVRDSNSKNNRIGADETSKFSVARNRGNIMSPSLSGNYTEMNGIDSETMGASSIHDDELSGQLQKENHINELHGNVDEVQTSNKLDGASFRRVLNEYEKTLSMFIQQIDQLKQRMDEAETEKQTLIKERDQALEDLRNVESAFSDVHRKYERAKALLENMKTNEDTLIRRDQEMMQRIQNRDKKIEMIKEKAQESIEKMHLDYETRIKEMEFENAKLRALNRKNEMKLSTLENDVEQKAKENAQLSALCDELINGQVGQV